MKRTFYFIIICAFLFSNNSIAFQQNMDVSPYGVSWIDNQGQFRFTVSDQAGNWLVIRGNNENDTLTVSFDDDSFFLVDTESNDLVFYNSDTDTLNYGLFGVENSMNLSSVASHLISKFAQHYPYIDNTLGPTDPFCHTPVPIGMPCPPDIGINSITSSQSTPYCQSIELQREVPFDGFSTLERCAQKAKYDNSVAFFAAIAGCFLSTTNFGATCLPTLAVYSLSHIEFIDRVDYCKTSFSTTQAALANCAIELNDESENEGGGSIANNTSTTPADNSWVDIAWNQEYRCRVVYTGRPGELVRQTVCFPI
ncbi:MAG: hypothetical protein M1356_01975 [Gammaproteobacteria bacterium]|nr:hypothetical protein [Gammaproteobacteria bacterium]